MKVLIEYARHILGENLMNRLQLIRVTGIIAIALVILLNVPYLLLIQTFEYDDILRQPVDSILTKFQAGGVSLILIWFVFGLSALLFIPVTILVHKAIDRDDTPYLTVATTVGAFSGIFQCIGLMRWVFVVPILSNIYTDPTTTREIREVVSVIFQVVHQYGGVLIGEHLGQTLLVGWTIGVCIVMQKSPLFKPWVAKMGLIIAPLMLIGQSELLATVIPTIPVLKSTAIGFMLWEIWLVIVGISLLQISRQRIILRQS
jgi:hypothetical protein